MGSCFAVGREQLNPGRVMWCDGKDDGAGRNLCVASERGRPHRRDSAGVPECC